VLIAWRTLARLIGSEACSIIAWRFSRIWSILGRFWGCWTASMLTPGAS
jgi:hypothetical protein